MNSNVGVLHSWSFCNGSCTSQTDDERPKQRESQSVSDPANDMTVGMVPLCCKQWDKAFVDCMLLARPYLRKWWSVPAPPYLSRSLEALDLTISEGQLMNSCYILLIMTVHSLTCYIMFVIWLCYSISELYLLYNYILLHVIFVWCIINYVRLILDSYIINFLH